MSSTWRPDDSLLEKSTGNEMKGARRVMDALKKAGIKTEGRIVTSRDKGMAQLKTELARTNSPKGFKQWQLPVVLSEGPGLAFMTVGRKGAKLPKHSHKGHLFRVIVSGSVRANGKLLKAGDWMLVPAGQDYSLEVGDDGVIAWHVYIPWPWPWPLPLPFERESR